MADAPRHPVASFLTPRSVAVVGASEHRGKVGEIVLRNLARSFPGELYAVNNRERTVAGRPSHRSVSAIGASVELAVIAVPAAAVPEVMRDCGASGVKAAIVLSAGFAEAGDEGERLEREVLAAAREHGVRVIGPNCLGVVRPRAGLQAYFGRTQPRAGALALVSQSGAICTALLDWADERGIGFSAVVSTGAAADVGFGDVLDYLALDVETKAILLYVEGVDHPRRFMSGLRAAARMKPVVVLKAGRKDEGGRAARSHTGALVGDDAVFESALRRAGALRARDLEELFSAAELLSFVRRVGGDRVAIVTNGGGLGVVAADRCADLGLRLAALAEPTLCALDAVLPAQWSHGNPVDVLGDAPPERYAKAVEAVLADPNVDGAIALLSPQPMTEPAAVADGVARAAERGKKRVLACFLGGKQMREGQTLLTQRGVPHLPSPEAAVESFAQLVRFERNQELLLQVPDPSCDARAPDLDAARAIVASALGAGRTLLDAVESKALLAAFRIPVTRTIAAPDAESAAAAAQELGFPVAIKIDSPELTHKSDVSGVALGVADADEARRTFTRLTRHAAQVRPDAHIRGVTVEPMQALRAPRELLVGVVRDAAFGPAIVFGAGGTLVELIADRAVALPPLNRLLAHDLIERTRVKRLLGEFRGMPQADVAAVEQVLLRVSELVCELPEVVELDVNPLIAGPDGVLAIDARVVLARQPASTERYPHVAIQPYPGWLARTVTLRDGTSLQLRPIRPEDARLEQRFVRQLSTRSRYFRFHQGIAELTREMLVRFTQIDYDREMAFIAVLAGKGGEEEVGVARYVSEPDGRTCELALVVADALQGKGAGTALMTALIETARERGLTAMYGEVLSENREMLELMRHLGFRIEPHEGDGKLRVVTLAL